MRDIMKKMRVRTKDGNSHDRYVLNKGVAGRCLAVRVDDEELFEQGADSVRIDVWDSCEEIKEESYKEFTQGILPIEYFSYRYREKATGIISIPTSYDDQHHRYHLKIDNGWKDNQMLFHEYEVYIDNKWQPVGIKL